MNINQLKYVLTIAGSSSMREASTKLFISQPALSLSVAELEEELGILIFERTNKGITLTEEGREFINYAKRTVAQYEILEDRYLAGDSDKERFSVSTQHYTFAVRAFTETIRRFEPDIYNFSIHETKTREVLEDVRSMKSEVGIISYSGTGEDILLKLIREFQLEFTPLMTRDACVYVWENHKFAKRRLISLEDLKDYPFVTFDQNEEGNYYLTEEALADYGFEKMIRSDDRATSMEIMASLGGYSIGSGMLAEDDSILKGMVSIRLKEEDPIVIGYITRKGSTLSEYGQAYVEEILKYKE